ncbi:MAG: hypothetical protein WC623_03965 [Pedobacter sp.]|uniref:hypothetical protein n=1 Tax=Pedobacter sp. TaxID=1411316 RepID=UPI0035634BEF
MHRTLKNLSYLCIAVLNVHCTSLEKEILNKPVTTSLAASQTLAGLVNLGPQVFESSINGSTHATDNASNSWFYTIQTGSPARLIGYNGTTASLAVNLPLTGVTGSWSMTVATDNSVYIASNQGILLRYDQTTQTVTTIGKPAATETYLWDLATGKNGEIFIGTYPGCRVYRYHPSSGFTDVGSGALITGENYVRSVEYHEPTDMVYAGVGSHTGLIELNPRTGQKREMLPAQDRGLTGFVYYLKVITGLTGGDRLLASITGTPSNNKTLVYNIQTGLFEKNIPTAIANTAIKSPTNQKIYYSTSSSLLSYEITQPTAVPVLVSSTKNSLARYWSGNQELTLLNPEMKIVKVNVSNGSTTSTNLNIPPLPIQIQTTAAGPDGKVWTSGYPIGSNGLYNPATGTTVNYNGLPQAESISFQGDQVFFGIYGGAKIYRYNSNNPWSMTSANPKLIGSVTGQDRPFGNVSVPTLGKMFFGTVPGYGILGGSLIEYNSSDDKIISYANIVLDQSIVSLNYANSTIIGGTSVWGGLGIQPTQTQAKLFGWNPVTKIKTFEIVPVTGAKAITALMQGPNGKIWGMADGTLFIFDPVTGVVDSTHDLFQVSQATKNTTVWRNASMVMHPTGRIFGLAYGELFELDPTTKAKTTISSSGGVCLTLGINGELYFQRGINLWSYNL